MSFTGHIDRRAVLINLKGLRKIVRNLLWNDHGNSRVRVITLRLFGANAALQLIGGPRVLFVSISHVAEVELSLLRVILRDQVLSAVL